MSSSMGLAAMADPLALVPYIFAGNKSGRQHGRILL